MWGAHMQASGYALMHKKVMHFYCMSYYDLFKTKV